MNTLGVIQARMRSRRLPGKVLRPIFRNESILSFLVQRIRTARSLHRIVIATSTERENDPVEALARELGVDLVRGPEDDVLARYIMVLDQFPKAESVVRITADNPLTDPAYLDQAVSYLHGENLHYTFAEGLPVGMAVDVFRRDLLVESAAHASSAHDREHINGYVLTNRAKFRVGNLPISDASKRPDVRVTVDTPEDFARVEKCLAHFGCMDVSTEEIIRYFDEVPR